ASPGAFPSGSTIVVSPFQESEWSTDGFGTDRLPRNSRNPTGILSGSSSLGNGSPSRIDVEGTERPDLPAVLGGGWGSSSADHGSRLSRTWPVEGRRQEVVDGLDDAVLDLGGESTRMPVIHHGEVGLVSALAEDPPRGDIRRHVVAVGDDPEPVG